MAHSPTRAGFSWLVALTAFGCASCTQDNTFEREFMAFGTLVSVSIFAVSSEDAARATARLEQRFEALGRAWYPQAPGELKDANEAIRHGTPVQVSPELKALLQSAADYERLSGGLFNVCLGHLLELWGFYDLPDSPAELPDAGSIAALLASHPSAEDLRWQGTELRSTNPAVMLDLGGIAKGAILRIALAELEKNAVHNAIVNIGGDLAVLGQVHGRAARIGIRAPAGGPPVAGLAVAGGEAVFTSGNYERYVEIDGQRYTHILDPKTGYPVDHTVSVTVLDADPVLADAAATALLVGGSAAFDELVAAFGLRYALLIPARGDPRLTPAMAERLDWGESNGG